MPAPLLAVPRLSSLVFRTARRTTPHLRASSTLYRNFLTSPRTQATALPITAHGPPPPTPLPSTTGIDEYRAKHKNTSKKSKRFWKEVHTVENEDGIAIYLDKRPLKTPRKEPLVLPKNRPVLAHAIALEWSNIHSATEAGKSYRIPLTQMAARAIDMAASEAQGDSTMRDAAIANLIRYLETDTVLCWAPTMPENVRDPTQPQLRDQQIEVARNILAYLNTQVWPGIEIKPVDGDEGLIGTGQLTETKETLIHWMRELDPWAFVGFERIVHSTKSFLIGARMVAEWGPHGAAHWGIMEAAEAATIEVRYQTRQWGEVEDSHDVENEDVRRQLGAGWLLIASSNL